MSGAQRTVRGTWLLRSFFDPPWRIRMSGWSFESLRMSGFESLGMSGWFFESLRMSGFESLGMSGWSFESPRTNGNTPVCSDARTRGDRRRVSR